MSKTALGIFFKHFFTTVRRRPLQPFLLVAVIAVAVAVCITALNTRELTFEEKSAAREATYGNANVKLNIDSESKSRFLFASDVRNRLTDEKMCGIFYFPVYINEENIFSYCVATDFADYGNIFDIQFCEYESFTEKERETTVFLSSRFAKENKIQIGDTLHIKMQGIGQDFTVRGISDISFMNQYDVMIDIDCLETVLTSSVLALAYSEIDIYPCSEVYIYSDNPSETVENLRAELTCRVDYVKTKDIDANAVETIMLVAMMLAVLFSMLTVFVIFTVLNNQRKEENFLLAGVGARPFLLTLFSLAEAFLYWAIGSGLGIALSLLLTQAMIDYVGYSFVQSRLILSNVLLVIAVMLIAVECNICLCTVLNALKKRREKRQKTKKSEKKGLIGLIVNLAIGVLYTVFIIIMNVERKDGEATLGYITILLNTFWIFSLAKYLFPLFWKKISEHNWKDITFRYATKNIFTIENNGNTAGIFAVFTVLAVILIMFTSLLDTMTVGMEGMISGDYLVTNIMSDGIEALENDENVKEIHRIYFGYVDIPGKGMDLVATDSIHAIGGDAMGLEQLPKKNEIAVSSSVLKKLELKVGDTVTATIEGKTYDMRICCSLQTNNNFAVVDVDYIDVEPGYWTVISKKDVSQSELYESITKDLSFQNATILPVSYLISDKISSNLIFVKSILFNSIFMGIFSAIGLLNSVLSSYRSRREEFSCYEGAGMTPKSIRKMKAKEIACTFSFGLLTAAIMVGIIYFTVYTFCINIWVDFSIL